VILEGDRLVATDLRSSGGQSSVIPAEPPPENAASATVSDSVPHQRIFEDFLRAVRDNTVPVCDAREARPSVAIIEAIYRSAETGRFETP
jgi:predicted dehydrogenase